MASFQKIRTNCLRGAVIVRSCRQRILSFWQETSWFFSFFQFALATHFASHHKMRHVPAEQEEGSLQRNFIHNIIKSLNGDAGFRWALSPVSARHLISRHICFDVFVNMRLLRRFRRYPGRLLLGRRVAAPPRKALPGLGSSAPYTSP